MNSEKSKGLTIISDAYIAQCYDYFGSDGQIDILQEECAELIQACSKMKRYGGPNDQLKEEMTHVLISLEVVALIYGITAEDITKELMKKAEKYNFKGELLCRIEK